MFDKQQSKKKVPEWSFDVEMDCKDMQKKKVIFQDVEAQVQKLKLFMRSGGEKKDFEQAQILLSGYLAAQKVLNRIGR